MGFVDKLEKKYGRYGISNLIYYVLGAYAIGYVLFYAMPDVYDMLTMHPTLVCKGQVWRLFTWIITIPQQLDVFVIFMFLFYFWIGTTLENYWGTFKYNLYMLSGWFFMTVGAMLCYVITDLAMGYGINIIVTTSYINLTSFLASAAIFPNAQALIFGLVPVKFKWLAIFDLVILGYDFIYRFMLLVRYNPYEIILKTGGEYTREACIAGCISIAISLLNFVIFYFGSRHGMRFTPKHIKRQTKYKSQVKVNKGASKHKCAICGRTELDAENLAFRYCSKCEGNYEYCTDHLFTHEHVKKGE